MKRYCPWFILTAAMLLTVSLCHAYSPATIEATAFDQVVGGVWTNYNEAAYNTLYVKSSGTAPPIAANAKSYFQFDIPADANTNGPLTLGYVHGNGNTCTLNVWALDQAYPTFNADITWLTAQANKTNSPYEMMTNGDYTATVVHTFPDTSGFSSFVTTVVPGPWGQFVHEGKLALVLAEIGPQYAAGDPRNTDPLYTSGGYRIALVSTYVDHATLTGGAPPSVGSISNLAVRQTLTSATNSFMVGDPEDGPDALVLTATSSNPNLVADADIHFGGSGLNRTVYVVGGPESDTDGHDHNHGHRDRQPRQPGATGLQGHGFDVEQLSDHRLCYAHRHALEHARDHSLRRVRWGGDPGQQPHRLCRADGIRLQRDFHQFQLWHGWLRLQPHR
jgi:hypothetical protein